MITSYVLYDDQNRYMATFAGPCRIAKWLCFPEGWSVERFQGDVSQGMVSLEDVRAHAADLTAPATVWTTEEILAREG